MSKDKLITIRIEGSKRIAFQKWSEKNKINSATFLYKVIDKCISGELSSDIIYPKTVTQKSALKAIQKNIQKLAKELEQKTNEQNSKLAILESEIESLKATLSSQKKLEAKSEKTDNKSKTSQQVDKRVDKVNVEENLLNDSQLAEILGVSRGSVLRWRLGQRKPSGQNSNLFDLYEVVGKKWRKKV